MATFPAAGGEPLDAWGDAVARLRELADALTAAEMPPQLMRSVAALFVTVREDQP